MPIPWVVLLLARALAEDTYARQLALMRSRALNITVDAAEAPLVRAR